MSSTPVLTPPECHVDVASSGGEGKEGASAHEEYQAGKTSSESVKRGQLVCAGGCRTDQGNNWKLGWVKKMEPKSLSEGIYLGKERLKHRVRHGKEKKNQEEKVGKEMEGRLGGRQVVVQDGAGVREEAPEANT